MRAENPHMHLASGEKRGYVTLELTQKACLARLRAIDSEKVAGSDIATLASFVVEDGRPGPKPV